MYISPEQDPGDRSATVWDRVDAQTEVDEALRSRAVVELENRLQHWNGNYLPRPTRFKNKHGVSRGAHLVVPADPVELVIVRAVAMTTGAGQFGVSPNGAIFTAEDPGWTIHKRRVDVTRLSWLLDEAADILQQIRGGRGGRFYERDGRFFLADGRTTILEVVDEPAPTPRAEATPTSATSRPWWQRAVDSIFGSDPAELPAPPGPPAGPQLPEDVRRARDAPLRRRTKPVAEEGPSDGNRPGRRQSIAAAGWRPQLCPKHFTEMPATGQCDECRTD